MNETVNGKVFLTFFYQSFFQYIFNLQKKFYNSWIEVYKQFFHSVFIYFVKIILLKKALNNQAQKTEEIMTKMIINDLSFIQIKTKRSPTSCALNSITTQKLKPYYNTVYQLFKLKNKPIKSMQEAKVQIQQEINKKIPEIIKSRRINQETHEFKIQKPYQKRRFNTQTQASKNKKCKSVTKSFFLTNQEYFQHKQKDNFGQQFQKLRKISKTLSQSTFNNKKKYNILDKYHKIIDHHYKNLQLEPNFIGGDEHEQNMISKNKDNRYKLQGNKWIENILVSNDSEHVSLVRKEKGKYLHEMGNKLNAYKGVNKNDIKQCKQIIQQDDLLMGLSLSHTIATTSISEIKSMYEMTRSKLTDLIRQHKTSRHLSQKRSEPRQTKSCRVSYKKQPLQQMPNYRQYKSYKKNQNQNPQTYRIGDRYSNFRSKQDKKGMMLKLKQHQKTKYTTKVMDVNLHRKLFLKNK